MAIYNLQQLDKRINALYGKYMGVKHIDQILTPDERATLDNWFEKWFVFYEEYRDRESELNQPTMQHLNNVYHEHNVIIDKYQKASDVIDAQDRQAQLEQQAEIEEDERIRYEREKQLKAQEEIERKETKKVKKSPVKATSHGTGTYKALAASFDELADLWSRIEVLPDQSVQDVVTNAFDKWQNFYYSEVQQYEFMETSIPDEIKAQLPKWKKLYNRTKKVIESAAGQSAIMDDPEIFEAIAEEKIKGGYVDPETGMIIPAEQLVKGMVAKAPIQPGIIPPGIIPGKGKPGLPSPMPVPLEPPYKPPPTVIIKQNYPPVIPSEPEIDPDEPMIYEPAIRTITDIGGGLVEPPIAPEDPFELEDVFTSSWPWFAALGAIIFFARSK
jgi:hypothetical protein